MLVGASSGQRFERMRMYDRHSIDHMRMLEQGNSQEIACKKHRQYPFHVFPYRLFHPSGLFRAAKVIKPACLYNFIRSPFFVFPLNRTISGRAAYRKYAGLERSAVLTRPALLLSLSVCRRVSLGREYVCQTTLLTFTCLIRLRNRRREGSRYKVSGTVGRR